MEMLTELLGGKLADAYADVKTVGYRRHLGRKQVVSFPRTVARRLDLLGKGMHAEDRGNVVLLSPKPEPDEYSPDDWLVQTNGQFRIPWPVCRRWNLHYTGDPFEFLDLFDRGAILPAGGTSALMAEILPGVDSERVREATEQIFTPDSLIAKVALGSALRHALVPDEPVQA